MLCISENLKCQNKRRISSIKSYISSSSSTTRPARTEMVATNVHLCSIQFRISCSTCYQRSPANRKKKRVRQTVGNSEDSNRPSTCYYAGSSFPHPFGHGKIEPSAVKYRITNMLSGCSRVCDVDDLVKFCFSVWEFLLTVLFRITLQYLICYINFLEEFTNDSSTITALY